MRNEYNEPKLTQRVVPDQCLFRHRRSYCYNRSGQGTFILLLLSLISVVYLGIHLIDREIIVTSTTETRLLVIRSRNLYHTTRIKILYVPCVQRFSFPENKWNEHLFRPLLSTVWLFRFLNQRRYITDAQTDTTPF